MRFRTRHIADSVVERIRAVAEVAGTDRPLPVSRGAATIHMERGVNGDLLVTKTFEHGEPEILTISNQATGREVPEGFTDITPNNAEQPAGEAPSAAPIDQGGIVENAALGGDAITQLLKT